LKAFEPILNRYFHEFITGIEKRAASNNGVVELNEWFHNLAFDVPCSLCNYLPGRLLVLLVWEQISAVSKVVNLISSSRLFKQASNSPVS